MTHLCHIHDKIVQHLLIMCCALLRNVHNGIVPKMVWGVQGLSLGGLPIAQRSTSTMQITAERKEGGSVTVEYEFGETLADLSSRFGDEVVRSHAQRSFVVALQSYIRSQLDQGKSSAEIQAAVNEWKPGQRQKGKSLAERTAELLSKMDPAARQALLKEYRSQAKQASA